MSLCDKTDEELSSLLNEYGIKHGPIVDSTRKLYEKKLAKAMEEAPEKPSSDKTYYREEEEEVTYITYHSPVKQENYTNVLRQRGNVEPEEDEEPDQESDQELDENIEPPVQISSRAANHTAAPSTKSKVSVAKKSGGCMWKLMKILLVLGVVAAGFYYALCRVDL